MVIKNLVIWMHLGRLHWEAAVEQCLAPLEKQNIAASMVEELTVHTESTGGPNARTAVSEPACSSYCSCISIRLEEAPCEMQLEAWIGNPVVSERHEKEQSEKSAIVKLEREIDSQSPNPRRGQRYLVACCDSFYL
jgi:hypothetical protein